MKRKNLPQQLKLEDYKKTPFFERHLALGAKMIPFAGYQMPVRYSSLSEEHFAVRKEVGVFDVSHMGEFLIRGNGATSLVSKISTNDIYKVEVGQAQYACMPNDQGGIVDDLIIYKLDNEEYLLVVNASNIEKDWDWIQSHNSYGVDIVDRSDELGLLAIQGPKATKLLQHLTDVNLSDISYYHFAMGQIAGIENVLISATGYTGSGGFEIYVSTEHALTLWDAILNLEVGINVTPAGLGARDTLRLEMGYCLYGNDIDDTTSPLEAGLGWITKFNHEFIHHKELEIQKKSGLTRRLVGFRMKDRGIPRQGYDVLNEKEELIGKVTSGTVSPMLERGIGMGYIDVPFHKRGTEILIQIRKKQLPAQVVKTPFVDLSDI